MAHDFQSDLDAIARMDAVPMILDVVCRTTGMRFAAVARVTEDRWIACGVKDLIAFGLTPGGELKIETTICNEIRDSRKAVVIDHVAEHPVYSAHHTPAIYGLQSYISMPIITRSGEFFGTLCAIDPAPAKLDNPETIGMFTLFADLIAFHLDAQRQQTASDALLQAERAGTELREQFIAVLGHDLRNPLAAIDAGTRLLQRTPLNERATLVVGQMQASVRRMSGLITNVLDFARGRLGGGLPVERAKIGLKPMLDLVTAEMQTSLPDRVIETDYTDMIVDCDPPRIGQMLSNLLGNAATHGTHDSPIRVAARNCDGAFELSVSNRGEVIPPAIAEQLFKPFFRASEGQQGLGLGLYIASEIARAHGGTLSVRSDEAETRFTFRIPQPRD